MNPKTTWTAALLLTSALALPTIAGATDFHDRDALAELLTLDEQGPLADAEEALAEAEAELADALAARDAAEQTLADAELAREAAEMDLADAQADLEAAVGVEAIAAAQAAVDEATAALETAQTDLETAQMDLASAEAGAETAQMAVDEGAAAVQAILDEIEATEELVANLSERQVFALNRALNNAVRSGLLPLDLDTDLLQRILDEDLGNREIQALTQAVELQARFELHAARFEAKAEATGNDKFLGHADRMRAKGESLKSKFLARLDDAGANEAAASQAQDAASAASAEAAADHANDAAGQTARELAQEGAKRAAGEAAREIARGQGRSGP